LITKFSKKYDTKGLSEKLIREEITKFIETDKLTEHELNRLDGKIKSLVTKCKQEDTLKKDLTGGNKETNDNINTVKDPQTKPDIGDNVSVVSRMSGVSHLSKYSEKRKNSLKPKAAEEEEDWEKMVFRNSHMKATDRLDFKQEGDEWNAIAKYNNIKAEEEIKKERIRDKETKKKTREALQAQMQVKQSKLKDERKTDLKHDEVLMQHVDYLNQVENEKEMKMHNKVIQEKNMRDTQLGENKKKED